MGSTITSFCFFKTIGASDMAYCTVAQVESEFKSIDFSATDSLMPEATVTQFIVEADALINSFVGQRYQVPVTSGDGLELLKLYSRTLVAERIKGIWETKNAVNSRADQNTRSSTLSKTDILNLLKSIAKGELALDGATKNVSGGVFSSYTYDNGISPVFKKEEKQW